MTSRSPYDADQPAPRITFASLDPAVAAFADIDAAHAAERNAAALTLAVMMTYADIGDRLRTLVERIAAALDSDTADRQLALEDAYHTLTELIGDPDPAPAPAVIVARVKSSIPDRPFDRIVIEHPDGTREHLPVPERVTLPSGYATRLGAARFHAALYAAGYRASSDIDADTCTVERITDTERTTTP